MKYVVTAMGIVRDGYKVFTQEDGSITRDEIIDTEGNRLFQGCNNRWDVEDAYESFWNRLNEGYVNGEIIKVLNVTEFGKLQK